MYVVFDKVAEESGPIFEAKNDAIALRKFNTMLQSEKVYDQGDYDLFYMGTVDHEKNIVYGIIDPKKVIASLDMEDGDNGTA